VLQRTLTTLLRTAASVGGSPFPRLTALRAVGVTALAGLLVTLAPKDAGAFPFPLFTYTLNFDRTCAIRQTDDAVFGKGDDEPYVLLFVGNLATGSGVVQRSTVFSGVNDGECRDQTVSLWGPTGTAADFPGGTADNLLVLVLPMEHDDCDVNRVQSAMQTGLSARLAQQVSQGQSRASIAAGLKTRMAIAAQCSVVHPWDPRQSEDEPIGFPQELRITATDISTANSGTSVHKTLAHDNRDVSAGGYYTTRFELQATPTLVAPNSGGATPN
jgi:hypothetical protein